MQDFYAIGDSHTTFFAKANIMKSHWLGPINAVTIYQLLKKDLDILNLTEDLAKSEHYKNVGVYPWQCPSGVYDVPNIKKGDCCVFFYGFNDIQKNIHKYAKDNSQNEIYNLIDSYLLLLKSYEHKYQITCVPCSIPPNPHEWLIENKKSGLFGMYGDFTVNGTSEERDNYTILANQRLRMMCAEKNMKFLDIYDEISDSNGFIKKEYTEDFVHLNCENLELVNVIKNIIKETL